MGPQVLDAKFCVDFLCIPRGVVHVIDGTKDTRLYSSVLNLYTCLRSSSLCWSWNFVSRLVARLKDYLHLKYKVPILKE